MSDSSDGDLQFEQADFGSDPAAGQTCSSCDSTIAGEYYTVNGELVCASCRETLAALLQAPRSAFSGFFRAALYGLIAAMIGTTIYYGISWITGGWEFGLIAIVVGFMVGKAVFLGSGSRGGRVFQVLAVLLTYCSIVSSYVPEIIESLQDQAAQQDATQLGVEEAGDAELAASQPPQSDAPVQETIAVAPAEPMVQVEEEFSLVELVIAYIFVFIFALALPFLAGFENLIGLVIIGIGLWQAWKLSARPDLSIDGPFSLGGPQAQGTAE
jgi:hypothetical protein